MAAHREHRTPDPRTPPAHRDDRVPPDAVAGIIALLYTRSTPPPTRHHTPAEPSPAPSWKARRPAPWAPPGQH